MKIFSRFIVFVFLFFICEQINAQITFNVKKDLTTIDFDKYISVYATQDSINTNQLLDSSLVWEENKISYGFSKSFYWLKFDIKNTTDKISSLYLEIDNPHLRYIEFYRKEVDSLFLKYRTGRHLSFDSRPVDNVKFIFPITLQQKELGSFFIKIDKRLSSVSFPIKIWSKNEFTKVYNKFNLLNGFYFGTLILAAIFSLVAFFFIKRKLYLLYFSYIIFFGLYMFTSAGYSFKYIMSNSISFNYYARVIFLVLTMFFHAKFVQSLLKTKVNSSNLHKFISIIAYMLLSITLLWLILDPFFKSLVTLYLKIIYVLIFLLIISFISVSIFTYRIQKRISKLYIFSFGAFFLSVFWALALEYSWVNIWRPTLSPLYFGSFFEILILCITLISELLVIVKEKEKLTDQLLQKKQDIVKAYIDGMEKEKLRISEELHDDIGSKLSILSRFLDVKEKDSKEVNTRINEIIDNVRDVSHKLSPNINSLFSFKEQIQNLVEESFYNSKINYELQLSKDYSYLKKNQTLNIYRILQEFLNNIVKHSKASKVEIQLYKLDENVVLTIEDNGIGFDKSKNKPGLGLLNIERRVDFLNGKLELSSVKGSGTFVVVSVPSLNT